MPTDSAMSCIDVAWKPRVLNRRAAAARITSGRTPRRLSLLPIPPPRSAAGNPAVDQSFGRGIVAVGGGRVKRGRRYGLDPMLTPRGRCPGDERFVEVAPDGARRRGCGPRQ